MRVLRLNRNPIDCLVCAVTETAKEEAATSEEFVAETTALTVLAAATVATDGVRSVANVMCKEHLAQLKNYAVVCLHAGTPAMDEILSRQSEGQ